MTHPGPVIHISPDFLKPTLNFFFPLFFLPPNLFYLLLFLVLHFHPLVSALDWPVRRQWVSPREMGPVPLLLLLLLLHLLLTVLLQHSTPPIRRWSISCLWCEQLYLCVHLLLLCSNHSLHSHQLKVCISQAQNINFFHPKLRILLTQTEENQILICVDWNHQSWLSSYSLLDAIVWQHLVYLKVTGLLRPCFQY